MIINKIILWITAIGCIIGGLDRIFGNKFGLGEKFEEGLDNLGPLAISMCGIICLAPVISNIVGPAVSPFFEALGCDPAVFGAIIANDTGGYQLAMGLAKNPEAGLYVGLIVGSMFGAAIVFLIPVGFTMIEKKDTPYYAEGILIGLISVPVGSIIGGLVAGFDVAVVLINIIPIAVLVIIISLGLKFFPNGMIKGCEILSKVILVVCTISIAAAGFESLTDITLIPGMAKISESLLIIGQIGIVLMGILPIVTILIRVLQKPLNKLSPKLGLDSASSACILISIASPMPLYSMYKDMNSRGKIMNGAFTVCAATALGDHLGFTASVEPDYIFPVIVGKLCGGIFSLILAYFLTKDTSICDKRSQQIANKH